MLEPVDNFFTSRLSAGLAACSDVFDLLFLLLVEVWLVDVVIDGLVWPLCVVCCVSFFESCLLMSLFNLNKWSLLELDVFTFAILT